MNFIKNKPIYIITGMAVSTTVFVQGYLNYRFFRPKKGINKMANIYQRQLGQVDDKMILKQVTSKDYFRFKFDMPYGIVFVKRIESIQKVLSIAQKYDILIINEDIERLEDYNSVIPSSNVILDQDDQIAIVNQKPFVVINQRAINHIEYDETTGLLNCGAGAKISDINLLLKKYGKHIPLDEDERIFQAFKKPNVNRDLIIGLTGVLPNGKAIKSPPNNIKDQLTQGLDFSQLFIGQNNRFGILVDVVIRPQNNQTNQFKQIKLDNNYVSQTNLFYLYSAFIQQRKNIQLKYDSQFDQYVIQSDLTIQKDLDTTVNQFVYPQLWQQDLQQKLELNDTQLPLHLQYQLNEKSMIDCLIELRNFTNPPFQLEVDFKKLFLTVKINDDRVGSDIRSVNVAKTITNFINNRNGIFVGSNDKKLAQLLRTHSIYNEQGLNHVHLEEQLRKLVDPSGVMIHQPLNPSYE